MRTARPQLPSILFALCTVATAAARIDRHAIVSRYNPIRTASSTSTPMQVGNGHFAFGADVTGLQTFLPWATMSDWGWKNDSLPEGTTQADVDAYRGVVWDGVQYMFGGPQPMQQWMISNPNRVNLGRVGLLFLDGHGAAVDVTEGELAGTRQVLDLWTGTITSSFRWQGESVTVQTVSAQSSDVVGVTVTSPLVQQGRLGIFLDFPWNDGTSKFEAPFVGVWNATANHTTTLTTGKGLGQNVDAVVAHTLVNSTFLTYVGGGSSFAISRVSPDEHRYNIVPRRPAKSFSIAIAYAPGSIRALPTVSSIRRESTKTWESFWSDHGFVDVVTGSSNSSANELQRRIILSQYLLRVNEAGNDPPQEARQIIALLSGLVNNGWYGKFHMEMFFWHSAHWALWNNWDLLDRATGSYARFLSTSLQRAQVQEGYSAGARWSKMTDPSGRSAPGQINELLIWQQPHPLVFAEYEYRATRSRTTLEKWRDVVRATADWMEVYATRNESTGLFDLGPPMYVVAEDTAPNATRNPAFELAYWRFGLGHASTWMERLGERVPSAWTEVRENLAPLPIENGLYAVYEGIPSDFWDTPAYTNDHPALVGLYGWLPQTANVSLDIAKATAEKVWTTWNISNCWGWDFPMLAMSAARNGETEKAIDWLLHPLFEFDDIGMPVGGVRVPTPYFPGSGALLYAIAMMAEGWDGSNGTAPGFPQEGWEVRVEGISKSL
ncbi:Six-hairpin glycosidase-like protein [Dichomitus squalens]|uniref:Six-hairpin glycosidase-like protein n=1 Tax=Dichomitus squalens TaxID=114155 RepID=A0A4Q9MIV2_9APHY|nr:Six-hairpin glycosidase-like protein [Dichomitus squalens]